MPTYDGSEAGSGSSEAERGAATGVREVPECAPEVPLLDELTAYYAARGDRLRQYARTIVKDHALAEDVVQQSYIRTYELIKAGGTVAHVPTWARRCVRNLAIDQLRREPVANFEDQRHSTSGASVVDQVHIRERWRAVEGAVTNLPAHLRQAFVLAEFHGLAYDEIAGEMNRSVGSIRQILRRARRHVRDIVGTDSTPLTVPSGGLIAIHGHAADLLRGLRNRVAGRLDVVTGWLHSVGGRASEVLAVPAGAIVVGALAITTLGAPTSAAPTAGDSPPLAPQIVATNGSGHDPASFGEAPSAAPPVGDQKRLPIQQPQSMPKRPSSTLPAGNDSRAPGLQNQGGRDDGRGASRHDGDNAPGVEVTVVASPATGGPGDLVVEPVVTPAEPQVDGEAQPAGGTGGPMQAQPVTGPVSGPNPVPTLDPIATPVGGPISVGGATPLH